MCQFVEEYCKLALLVLASYLLNSWESGINLLIYLLRGTIIHTFPLRCDRYGSTSLIKKKKESLDHSSNGKQQGKHYRKKAAKNCMWWKIKECLYSSCHVAWWQKMLQSGVAELLDDKLSTNPFVYCVWHIVWRTVEYGVRRFGCPLGLGLLVQCVFKVLSGPFHAIGVSCPIKPVILQKHSLRVYGLFWHCRLCGSPLRGKW